MKELLESVSKVAAGLHLTAHWCVECSSWELELQIADTQQETVYNCIASGGTYDEAMSKLEGYVKEVEIEL